MGYITLFISRGGCIVLSFPLIRDVVPKGPRLAICPVASTSSVGQGRACMLVITAAIVRMAEC